MREMQYAIYELKASQAEDKAVDKRTDGKTKYLIKYCNIPGICVPTRNVFQHEGSQRTRERSNHVKRGLNATGKERVAENKKEA